MAIRNIISISYYSCLWEAIALNKNARESVPSSRSIQNFNWDSSILNVPVFDNFKHAVSNYGWEKFNFGVYSQSIWINFLFYMSTFKFPDSTVLYQE